MFFQKIKNIDYVFAFKENHLSTPTLTERVEQIIEGDTYPISDNESTPDSGNLIDTNVIKLQGDFNDSMSQDSLTNEETNSKNKFERPQSSSIITNSKLSSKMSTMKSTTNGTAALRSLALDEHIKLVKQKKEEAEILRLQKFQEQLRKKEQKWQQQQLERVKKWLQLRNRDIDHRTQVEERRKKREEEAKAKIDELIRREKEREQRVQHNRAAAKPDNVMTMSTDVAPSRRAISASRLRSTHHDRRYGNDSSDDNCNVHDEIIERRPVNSDRQHINETIRRLAKPKNLAMTQSIHPSSHTAKTMPVSRSSHQLRMPTSSTTTNRRQPSSRPATVPTSIVHSRTSPSDETKVPSVSKKPPIRSKPVMTRSLMTTSHSSSSISSSIKRRPIPNSKPPNEIEPVVRQTKSDDEREQTPPIAEESKTQTILDEQEYQRKLNQKIREAQQRLEVERQREEERQRQLELEEFEREQEQIRLVEEQRRAEQERLQRAIEERERENELKRQEELRLQVQREELERKQIEETERLNRERQEKARKEEEERIERKKRLDLIMRRTRQTSPTSKQDESNGHNNNDNNNNNNDDNTTTTPTTTPNPISPKSLMSHSISDNHFPTSTSTDNFLLTNSVATPSLSSTTDLPKFKSPLIQSLLNKARSTRSTDNLIQTSLTSSQILTESIIDETLVMTKSTDLSQENGHSLSRPIEAATAAAFQ